MVLLVLVGPTTVMFVATGRDHIEVCAQFIDIDFIGVNGVVIIIVAVFTFPFVCLIRLSARNAESILWKHNHFWVGRVKTLLIDVLYSSRNVFKERVFFSVLNEFCNIDPITNVFITIFVRIHTKLDGVPVAATMRTNVGYLSIVALYLSALEILGKFVVRLTTTQILVNQASIVLITLLVIVCLTEVASPNIIHPSLIGDVLEITVAGLLQPFRVHLVHTLLTVCTVLLESFTTVFIHDLEIILKLNHVFSIVRLAP
mmetsp:Transcript_3610/g.8022  ORF Transcript_3610/g.8022 Transcript_3610/m.8022 type:complete len:258 (+) Transcript_3610:545-1318(+)